MKTEKLTFLQALYKKQNGKEVCIELSHFGDPGDLELIYLCKELSSENYIKYDLVRGFNKSTISELSTDMNAFAVMLTQQGIDYVKSRKRINPGWIIAILALLGTLFAMLNFFLK